MPKTHRRLLAAIAAIAATGVLLSLTGCARHDAFPKEYGHAWLDRMTTLLGGGEDGQGGAGGQLLADDDDDHGPITGSAALQYELSGPYDVLAVCRSTATVHLTIRDFTARKEHDGESTDPRTVLDEGDIVCGATTRLSITVPADADGIMLDVSTADRSGRALWDAAIVPRGWTP
ncbi:hypothetical protein ACIPEP_03285 [Curtobacterium sp. NPDC087082]|uniref:hypothetical protein n=1 Tax=Curtobacterium sp. NPDC087082 TaxID=3363966 RepID=UPI00381E1E73